MAAPCTVTHTQQNIFQQHQLRVVLARECVPLKFECVVINEGVAIAMQIKLQVAINLNKRQTMQIYEIHCK